MKRILAFAALLALPAPALAQTSPGAATWQSLLASGQVVPTSMATLAKQLAPTVASTLQANGFSNLPVDNATVNGQTLTAYEAQQALAMANLIPLSAKGQAGGVAALDGNGRLPSSVLPAISGDVSSVAGSPVLTLVPTGVAAGRCVAPTVDAKGRATVCTGITSSDLPAATASVPGAVTLAQVSAAAPVQSVTGALALSGGVLSPSVGTGVGTLAAGNDARIVGAAQAGNNLSDLTSPASARANLGLGGAALLGVGTGAGTVAAGNDARIVGALQSSALGTASGPAQLDATGSIGRNVASSLWSSAQAKTLGLLFSHRINVKMLGAVGDGVTDDTAAFQNALTQATALNVGSEIDIPAGRYVLSSTLIATFAANQSVYVHGAGQTNTILDFQIPSSATNFDGFDVTLGNGTTGRGFKNTACPSLVLSGQTVGAQSCVDNLVGTQGFYLRDVTVQTDSPSNSTAGTAVFVSSNQPVIDVLPPSATISNVSFIGGATTDGNRNGEAPGCAAWKYGVHYRNVFSATVNNFTVQGSATGAPSCPATGSINGWIDGAGVYVEAANSYGAQSQGIVVTGGNVKYYHVGVALSGVQQGDTISANSFFGNNYGVAIGGGVIIGSEGTTQTLNTTAAFGATSLTLAPTDAAKLAVGMKIVGNCLPLATITSISGGTVNFQSIVATGGTLTTTAGASCSLTNSPVSFTGGDVLTNGFGSGGLTISGNGFDTTIAGVYAPVDPSTFLGFSQITVSGNVFLQNTTSNSTHVDIRIDKSDQDVITGNQSLNPHGAPSSTQFFVANLPFGNHPPVVNGNYIDTSGSALPAISLTGGIGGAVTRDNEVYGSTILGSDAAGASSTNLWGCNDFVTGGGVTRQCGLPGVAQTSDQSGPYGRWEANQLVPSSGVWRGSISGTLSATAQGTAVSGALTPAGLAPSLPSGVTASAASVAGSYTVALSSATGIIPGMTLTDGSAIPSSDVIKSVSGSTATIGPYPLAGNITSGDAITVGYGPSFRLGGSMPFAWSSGAMDALVTCHDTGGGNRFTVRLAEAFQSGIGAEGSQTFSTSTATYQSAPTTFTGSLSAAAASGQNTISVAFAPGTAQIGPGWTVSDTTTVGAIPAGSAVNFGSNQGGALQLLLSKNLASSAAASDSLLFAAPAVPPVPAYPSGVSLVTGYLQGGYPSVVLVNSNTNAYQCHGTATLIPN